MWGDPGDGGDTETLRATEEDGCPNLLATLAGFQGPGGAPGVRNPVPASTAAHISWKEDPRKNSLEFLMPVYLFLQHVWQKDEHLCCGAPLASVLSLQAMWERNWETQSSGSVLPQQKGREG